MSVTLIRLVHRYRDFPLFKMRYQIGNLLGKGGFSEVYLATDLVTMKVVALKIHEVILWHGLLKIAFHRSAYPGGAFDAIDDCCSKRRCQPTCPMKRKNFTSDMQ